MITPGHPSALLAEFAASLRHDAIPDEVLRRTEERMLDCLASVLAGSSAPAVRAIANYADAMGPNSGPSENLVSGRGTSPVFAAMVHAAAAHMAQQDDAHNDSVFCPAAVVFPPAIAVAQALGRSGAELLAASVAGYEVGIRVGEFLGRSDYGSFHTSGTAATLAAAAAVGNLLRLDSEQMLHALGSAGAPAAGLWQFLNEAAGSKPLHTGRAAANGLMAAWLAKEDLAGARQIPGGSEETSRRMPPDAALQKLADGLGSRWAVLENAFKYPASHGQTHPATDAQQERLQETRAEIEDKAMRLGTYRNAADADTVRRLIEKVWTLREAERVQHFINPET